MSSSNQEAWWSRTRNIMCVSLAVWLFFGYLVHFLVDGLNSIVILGFPLGYYMAGQGSLIAFCILIFWYCSAQNGADREFGVAEDE